MNPTDGDSLDAARGAILAFMVCCLSVIVLVSLAVLFR